MVTTQQVRNWYAPPCAGADTTISLNGTGRVTVRVSINDAVKALDAVLIKYGYKTRRADTGAYNCRRITGGTGWSLHAYKIALDLNWTTNPYGPRLITDMPLAMLHEIEAIRTKSGAQVWRAGAFYSGNKDAMHFEIICSPQDLASGIRGTGITKPKGIYLDIGATDENAVRWTQFFCNALRVKLRKGATGKPGIVIEEDGDYGKTTKAAVAELQRGIRLVQQWTKVPRTQWIRTDGIVDQRSFDLFVFWYANRAKL